MAYPFNPNNLRRAAPRLPLSASPPKFTHTLAEFARVAVLWSLLGLGIVGGGAGVVWLVTSPDDIDAKILTLTGRGRP